MLAVMLAVVMLAVAISTVLMMAALMLAELMLVVKNEMMMTQLLSMHPQIWRTSHSGSIGLESMGKVQRAHKKEKTKNFPQTVTTATLSFLPSSQQ